jgi:MFS family permease
MSAVFILKRKLALAPAFRSRNFRLFWLAQLISTIGTALQVVVEGWLVYQVTDSTLWLGLVSFIGLLPVVPLAFLGGVLIDRLPRRKLLLLTQSGLLLQSTLFALLVRRGDIQLWQIIVLYFLFGALLAIDHPARRAFLVDLVGPDDLANAVALNTSLYNISNLIGFGLSGFLLATIGPAGTMFLNAISYLAPILALALIRVPDIRHDTQRPHLKEALSAGIVTLWQKPTIMAVIVLMAAVGGLAWPIFGMMPAFAQDVLGTSTVGLGLLLAAGALGSVIGTAVVASRVGRWRRGRSLRLACVLLPIMVMGVACSKNIVLAGIFVAMVGLLLIIVQSLAVTLVHVGITDQVRGRVMSLYSMVHAGADTASNLMVGGLAITLGLPLAIGLGGALALFIAGIFGLTMPAIRRLK